MRELFKTLENGLSLYRVDLVGGPADGSQSLASGDIVMVIGEQGAHHYRRGADDRYYHHPDCDGSSPQMFWAGYRDQVYQGAIVPAQELECSRAFYAGMQAMMSVLLSVAELSDGRGEQILEFYRRSIELAAKSTTKP